MVGSLGGNHDFPHAEKSETVCAGVVESKKLSSDQPGGPKVSGNLLAAQFSTLYRGSPVGS